MHAAAALGKPLLAVFGGGTWPRFLPAVEPSVTVTVGVSCEPWLAPEPVAQPVVSSLQATCVPVQLPRRR